jgi:hypothetical protein
MPDGGAVEIAERVRHLHVIAEHTQIFPTKPMVSVNAKQSAHAGSAQPPVLEKVSSFDDWMACRPGQRGGDSDPTV